MTYWRVEINSQLMRSGTRKVADSKPDAATTSKEGDAIQMDYIGMFLLVALIFPFHFHFLMHRPNSPRRDFDFNFVFSNCFFAFLFWKKILWTLKGTEIITEEEGDDEDQNGAGFCEQVAMAAGTIGAFIYKNSYIFTNVVMMVSWRFIHVHRSLYNVLNPRRLGASSITHGSGLCFSSGLTWFGLSLTNARTCCAHHRFSFSTRNSFCSQLISSEWIWTRTNYLPTSKSAA